MSVLVKEGLYERGKYSKGAPTLVQVTSRLCMILAKQKLDHFTDVTKLTLHFLFCLINNLLHSYHSK